MSEAGAAIRRLARRAEGPGTRAAAEAGVQAMRDETRRKLSMKSHGRGSPTPSAPGTPPARISGALAGSVIALPPTGGGGVWRAYEGPRGIVYAAIQNFGGVAGRNHASHLPPRPYTGVDAAFTRISQSSASAFYRNVFGG